MYNGDRDSPLNARPLPFFTTGVSLVILIGLVAALSSQTAPSPSLTLLARDGRRALPITLLADQEFVALDDLAAAFQLAIHEESLGAITVTYKGKTIVLTPEQALASVSGRLVSLPAPPTRNGRRWLVPVEFISRALTLVYDVAHNIAKLETHAVGGKQVRCMVHRKGATRAFPAGHRDVPRAYRHLGQPVLSRSRNQRTHAGSPVSVAAKVGSG